MQLRDLLDPLRHAACTAEVDGSVAAVVVSMAATGAACCVVSSAGRPVGIVTSGDLLRRVHGGRLPMDSPVRAVMTENPVVAGCGDPVLAAFDLMMGRGVHHLPVMAGASVVGVLRLVDIAAAVFQTMETQVLALEQYIADLHSARED